MNENNCTFANNITISGDEYYELVTAKAQLDLILACSGANNCGSGEIIKQIKKSRDCYSKEASHEYLRP